MSDYTPLPMVDDLADLGDLCEETRERLLEGYRRDLLFNPLMDPPVDCYAASVFVLIATMVVILAETVALVAVSFSLTFAICSAAFGAVVFLIRMYVRRKIIAPRNRWMQEARVVPAVVVQAYGGGYVPPENDPDTPSFTGVVVYRLDGSLSGEQLTAVARGCFAAKEGPDQGELAELKQMLLSGDNDFVRSSFRFPTSIPGNDQTFAAPILFVREHDLFDGFLSTSLQLVFVHPERTDHPVPVPPEFWVGQRSLELLTLDDENEESEEGHEVYEG